MRSRREARLRLRDPGFAPLRAGPREDRSRWRESEAVNDISSSGRENSPDTARDAVSNPPEIASRIPARGRLSILASRANAPPLGLVGIAPSTTIDAWSAPRSVRSKTSTRASRKAALPVTANIASPMPTASLAIRASNEGAPRGPSTVPSRWRGPLRGTGEGGIPATERSGATAPRSSIRARNRASRDSPIVPDAAISAPGTVSFSAVNPISFDSSRTTTSPLTGMPGRPPLARSEIRPSPRAFSKSRFSTERARSPDIRLESKGRRAESVLSNETPALAAAPARRHEASAARGPIGAHGDGSSADDAFAFVLRARATTERPFPLEHTFECDPRIERRNERALDRVLELKVGRERGKRSEPSGRRDERGVLRDLRLVDFDLGGSQTEASAGGAEDDIDVSFSKTAGGGFESRPRERPVGRRARRQSTRALECGSPAATRCEPPRSQS